MVAAQELISPGRDGRTSQRESGISFWAIKLLQSLVEFDHFPAGNLSHALFEGVGNLYSQHIPGAFQNLPALFRRQRFNLFEDFSNAHQTTRSCTATRRQEYLG